MIHHTFSEAEFSAAAESWNCNCGPGALAFALQVKPDDVRHALPDFEDRGYTNPTMMKAALATLGRDFFAVPSPAKVKARHAYGYQMFAGPMSLVRVQFTGPWTANGKPMKWAARQTHWIACWCERDAQMVFDVNGGMRKFDEWERQVVPAIVATIDRADGGWYPANVWRLK